MPSLSPRRVAVGQLFFRWRSYLPYLLALPLIVALPQSGWFETAFGEAAEIAWDVFAALVAFAGLGIRVAAVGVAPVGTSGRNARAQRADSLNTTGLYSVVRNPLYLGNAIIVLGLALSVKVWWIVPLALAATGMFYARVIAAEEAFLHGKFGAVYDVWRARTPVIVPDFGLWRRAELPFSLRNVLRREYNGFYQIVVALTAIEFASDVLGEGIGVAAFADEDEHWLWFLGFGTVVWLVLRALKKHTEWLRVEGR